MTSATSAIAERPAVLGAQRPRILQVPEFVSSTGAEAVELAAMAGLHLDPWQQLVMGNALGERPDGSWAAFEVGVEVPRQNGKGGILEARGLAGLFLLGERLIIHSAHEFATAEEALERMAQILEANEDLSRRVKAVKRSHGQEGIYLLNGQRLRYKTRTKGGGRGFSADCVILDEAMVIPGAFLGALMPTLSARPNPQLWYAGSAVDQEHMEHGVVFARVRDRAIRGEDPSLAYFGWSPAFDKPSDIPPEVAADPVTWAQANPALGIRIGVEHVANEHRSMDSRTFAVERLGVGDWPPTDENEGQVISSEAWAALRDDGSGIAGPVWLAYDMPPDRSAAAIAAAGRRADGLYHVEVIAHERGTGWVADRLDKLVKKHGSDLPITDSTGPAAALLPELQALGVRVVTVSAKEHAQGCGLIFDAVDRKTVRHLGTPELAAAIKGAVKRPLGDAWAWSRKSSAVDISPLVACTLALWGCVERGAQFGGGIAWR